MKITRSSGVVAASGTDWEVRRAGKGNQRRFQAFAHLILGEWGGPWVRVGSRKRDARTAEDLVRAWLAERMLRRLHA